VLHGDGECPVAAAGVTQTESGHTGLHALANLRSVRLTWRGSHRMKRCSASAVAAAPGRSWRTRARARVLAGGNVAMAAMAAMATSHNNSLHIALSGSAAGATAHLRHDPAGR
jgi:hypothetical protein